MSRTPLTDAERLDFLEKHRCYPWWNFTRWMMNIGEGAKITAKGEGQTVRECIDATIRAAQ